MIAVSRWTVAAKADEPPPDETDNNSHKSVYISPGTSWQSARFMQKRRRLYMKCRECGELCRFRDNGLCATCSGYQAEEDEYLEHGYYAEVLAREDDQ